MYGTNISDASIENFRKLKRLEKIFLWQTKVTPNGAESLRKNFVDPNIYANLIKEKASLSEKVNKVAVSYEAEISRLEDRKATLSQKTDDGSPINEKCPVSTNQ